MERSWNLISNRPAIGNAVVHGLAPAIACLISYWLSTAGRRTPSGEAPQRR